MSYTDIVNTYKNPDIFLFREVWATEKVHGTAAHLKWKGGVLHIFSGAASHERFSAIFDIAALTEKFVAIGHPEVTVYGEAYGGKLMGMSATYGKDLGFVAFDVKVGELWLAVPQAEDVAKQLGLEFVHYVKCSTDLAEIDRERDAPSVQAKRNGIAEDKPREGVVLRPLIELTKNNGDRIIAKHKRPEFMETATPREVDPARLKILEDAKAIADEWVTPMRLTHVLQRLPNATDMRSTADVIREMVEDVKREAAGEVVWSKDAQTAIGRATAQLFKQRLAVVHEDDGLTEAE